MILHCAQRNNLFDGYCACQKDPSTGGGERDRTDDLLRARQALSQLSYTPNKLHDLWWAWMESNHRPHAYQACALTDLSYRPPNPRARTQANAPIIHHVRERI